jgi:hypothetical protein
MGEDLVRKGSPRGEFGGTVPASLKGGDAKGITQDEGGLLTAERNVIDHVSTHKEVTKMKKLAYLLIVLSLVLALVPAAAFAHTEGEPFVTDLIAGQTTDIGDVLVWNDVDTLYVKFVYEGPDCGFLEVHLQVDADAFSPDILTKKGNPIPGQFEKSYDVGCFKEHTFTYSLADEGFGCDDNLLIAAHAALGREEAMAIVSGDGNTIVTQRRSGDAGGFTPVNAPAVLAWEPGPNYPNDGPDDSSWEAWSLWDQQLSIDLRTTGADWIWEAYRVLDPVYGTVLTLQRTFDIGYPIDGNLLIACDNGYEVFLNGVSLGSHGVYGAWRNSNLKQGFVPQDGWNVVGSYSLLNDLVAGANVLTIDAANEYFNTDDPPNPWAGTVSNNPGACIFAADIDYYADGETAWGCGTDNCYEFSGKNWATYFTYAVQCCTNVPEVVNGSFENPVVTASQGWDIYDSGYPDLGWTVEWRADVPDSWGGWDRPDPAHLELHHGVNNWSSHDGDQHAELDTDWNDHVGSLNNEPASVKIYQDLATCPGETYELTYAWSPRPGHGNNSMEVYWGGNRIATHSGSGGSNTNWTVETHNVTTSDYSTRLEFVETGTNDSLGMFLDAVSVTTP